MMMHECTLVVKMLAGMHATLEVVVPEGATDKWSMLQQIVEGMRATIEVVLPELDPADTEEAWLRRELGQVHDLVTGCISHCGWNAKENRSERDG